MQEMEREINEHTGTGVVTFQQRGRRNAIPVGEAVGPEGLEQVGNEGWVSVFSLLAPVLGTHCGAGWGNDGRL